jgi:hypothetical protein
LNTVKCSTGWQLDLLFGTAPFLFASFVHSELEEGDIGEAVGKGKKEIVALGTSYGLASKYTSFVCVEDREEAVVATMESRTIPLPAPVSTAVAQPPPKAKSSAPRQYNGGGGEGMTTRSKLNTLKVSLATCTALSSRAIKTPFGIIALVSALLETI